jgi:hypothetical protein
MADETGGGTLRVWITLDPPRHVDRFSRIPVRVNGQDTTGYVADIAVVNETWNFGDPPLKARRVGLDVGVSVEIS